MLKHSLLILLLIIFSISGVLSQVVSSRYDLAFSSYECGIYSGENFSYKELSKEYSGILRLRRNLIYAHYGRIFNDPLLQTYFAKKDWYKPNPEFSFELLSEVDLENIKLILKVESEIRAKYPLNPGLKADLEKLREKDFTISEKLRVVDVFEVDLDNDQSNDVILLSLPWAYHGIRDIYEPGEYWQVDIFAYKEGKWISIPFIEYPRNLISDDYSYIIGDQIRGYITSFEGTNYIKMADMNENGIKEIYLHEDFLASSPGQTKIFEYKEGSMVTIFSKEGRISDFQDIDGDGIKEMITNWFNPRPDQVYTWLFKGYENKSEVFKFTDGKYTYSKQLSIEYLKSLVEASKEKLIVNERNDIYDLGLYAATLRYLVQLKSLGDTLAYPDAIRIIDHYHRYFEGNIHSREELLERLQKVYDFGQ